MDTIDTLDGLLDESIDIRILNTTSLETLNNPGLNRIYKKDVAVVRFIGSIINAVITSKLPIFLLAKSIVDKVILNDANLETKTINGSQYKFMIKLMIDAKILENVYKPSTFGQVGSRRAGLFKLIDKNFIGLVDSSKEEAIIKLYDSSNQKKLLQKKSRL